MIHRLEHERLDSWKQIAAYLGKSERTVRRWQQTEGLPVHRHVHLQKGSVWAYRRELDAWLRQRVDTPSDRVEDEQQEVAAFRAPETFKSSKLPWVATGLAVPAVAAIAAWLGIRAPAPIPVLEPVPLTAFQGAAYGADFSPDRKHVAFYWSPLTSAAHGIYVMPVGETSAAPRPLAVSSDRKQGSGFRYSPAWSPDGSLIAFVRRDPTKNESHWLCLIPAAGGEERCEVKLSTDVRLWGHNRHVSWTPDSKWVVAPISTDVPQSGIYAISIQTGERRLLSGPIKNVAAPALSPDGKVLIYVHWEGSGFDTVDDLVRQNVAADWRPSGPPATIYKAQGFVGGWAWTPAGDDIVVCTSASGFGAHYDTHLFRMPARLGGARTLIQNESCSTVGISQADENGFALLAYASPDRANTTLTRAPIRNLAEAAPFVPSSRVDYLPEFSPDGRHIAFVSNRSGQHEIWLASKDGSQCRKLTDLSRVVVNQSPRWSPDGTRLVYSAFSAVSNEHAPRVGLRILPVSAGPPAAVPLQRDARHPAWSADGRFVYYWTDAGLWRVRPDGREDTLVRRIPPVPAGFRLAVRGNYLYFVIRDELKRVDLATGSEERIASGLTSADFAVSDRNVYFERSRERRSIFMVPIAGGAEPREIGQLPVPPWAVRNLMFGLTVTPDDTELMWSTRGPSMDLQLIRQFR